MNPVARSQTQKTPFPEVVQRELREIAEEARWEEYVDEICMELEAAARLSADQGPGSRTPRPHQVAALEAWAQRGRRGILEHATGSGKTFTALCAIRSSLDRCEIPLVLVPSELLLNQWREELTQTFESDELLLLVCGGGNQAWKKQRRLSLWTRDDSADDSRVVLNTRDLGVPDHVVALALLGDVAPHWSPRGTSPTSLRTRGVSSVSAVKSLPARRGRYWLDATFPTLGH